MIKIKAMTDRNSLIEVHSLYAFIADDNFYVVSDTLNASSIAIINLSDITHISFLVPRDCTLEQLNKAWGIKPTQIFTDHEDFCLELTINK